MEHEMADEKQKQQKRGSQRRIPGLTLYEYNITSGDVIPVAHSGRVTMRQGCVYFQALNLKNAQRKAERFFLQSSTATINDIISAARKEAGLETTQA